MSKKQLLLISSSKVYGYGYLEHQKDDIIKFFDKNNVKEVTFVPYAQKDYDNYTKTVSAKLTEFGYKTRGVHQTQHPVEMINTAECIFIGGGNTFLLLKTLYDLELMAPIRKRILIDGRPYMGSSAGTNVSTINIKTTNDMPIVFPPSFDALQLVSFNINPHYMDADQSSTHQGETRETRINEFHEHNKTPVLGIREGSSLLVDNNNATLIGTHGARLFQQDKEPIEYPPNSDLSFLLEWIE